MTCANRSGAHRLPFTARKKMRKCPWCFVTKYVRSLECRDVSKAFCLTDDTETGDSFLPVQESTHVATISSVSHTTCSARGSNVYSDLVDDVDHLLPDARPDYGFPVPSERILVST